MTDRIQSARSEKPLVKNGQKNGEGTGSPSQFSQIRSPAHWLAYPAVIQGAIQRATSRITDVEYRRKIVNCLTDVMSNRLTMTAAHQLHFKTRCMNDPRICRIKARELLVDLLGEEKVDERLQQHLTNGATFEKLKKLVDSFKNASESIGSVRHKLNGNDASTSRATQSKNSKIVMFSSAQKRISVDNSSGDDIMVVEQAAAKANNEMNKHLVVCCFCDTSVDKNALWDHIARDLDYRPYDCSNCQETFVNKAELTEHETENDGHKGNYAGKIHNFKETMIRQIFSETIKASPSHLGNRGSNRAITIQGKALAAEGSKLQTTQSTSKASPKSGLISAERCKTLTKKRRRRSSVELLLLDRSAERSSTPKSNTDLPSLSPASIKTKMGTATKPSSILSSNSSSKRAKNVSKSAGSGQLPPKKSRLVAYKNGASTEYEDTNSNANLETNTDDDINGNLSHKLNTNKLSLSNPIKASNKKLSMNDGKTTPSFKRGPRISDSINSNKKDGNQSKADGEDIFQNACFSSFDTFKTVFDKWRILNNHPFRIASSEKFRDLDGNINQQFQYKYVVYQCVHYGELRSRGNGERDKQALPCGCQARLRLIHKAESNNLMITMLQTVHNHKQRHVESYTRGDSLKKAVTNKFAAKTNRNIVLRFPRPDLGVAPTSGEFAKKLQTIGDIPEKESQNVAENEKETAEKDEKGEEEQIAEKETVETGEKGGEDQIVAEKEKETVETGGEEADRSVLQQIEELADNDKSSDMVFDGFLNENQNAVIQTDEKSAQQSVVLQNVEETDQNEKPSDLTPTTSGAAE